MKEIFKQLIIDFQGREIPLPTPREHGELVVPKGLRKAFVLVGMRRSGKTWSLYQQMHTLISEGISRKNLLYINFEDDRLAGTTLEDLQSLLDAFYELNPKMEQSHFFFDEIHEVPGWERFVRRLLDTETMQIYLTGSSAKMLSIEIASSLRGRTLVREVFPYNFREYLEHLNVEVPSHMTSKQKSLLNHHLQNYSQWGGFPETVGLDVSLHREILQGYIDAVIYRDIIERYTISNVAVLRKLLTHCLQNPASLFSLNKTFQSLKSQGYAVSKNTLYTFMEYFEDAYCVFSLPVFNFSTKKGALKPKKIYPVDPGLITAFTLASEYQKGPALESMVFTLLLRRSKNIHYISTQKGREVDFFVTLPDNSHHLVQVTLSIKNPKTREREITALQQAMQETGLKKSTIITLDEEEMIERPEGTIAVCPLLSFALDKKSL